MRIAFTTLGCKLNYAETSTYERGFVAAGWEVVPWTAQADVYLVNPCSVTETAEKKSRNLIRRAHKTAPEARIVVTGCYAELRKEQLLGIEGVWKVFGATEKKQIVEEVTLWGDSVPLRFTPAPPTVTCTDRKASFPAGTTAVGPLPLPWSGGGQAPRGVPPSSARVRICFFSSAPNTFQTPSMERSWSLRSWA